MVSRVAQASPVWSSLAADAHIRDSTEQERSFESHTGRACGTRLRFTRRSANPSHQQAKSIAATKVEQHVHRFVGLSVSASLEVAQSHALRTIQHRRVECDLSGKTNVLLQSNRREILGIPAIGEAVFGTTVTGHARVSQQHRRTSPALSRHHRGRSHRRCRRLRVIC